MLQGEVQRLPIRRSPSRDTSGELRDPIAMKIAGRWSRRAPLDGSRRARILGAKMSSPDDLLRAWRPSPKLPPMDPNPLDAASRRTCSSIEVPAAHGILNARSRACGVGPGRRCIVDRVDRLLLERASGQGATRQIQGGTTPPLGRPSTVSVNTSRQYACDCPPSIGTTAQLMN
jgi:hypothetical protein